MTRKAFIIASFKPGLSPEEKHSNLQIEADWKNMQRFLETYQGGLWINTEDLHILVDKSKSIIMDLLGNSEQNYTFIYFSGHGGVIEQKEVIELKDGEQLAIAELRSKSLKQTIIIEACRSSLVEESNNNKSLENSFTFPQFKKIEERDIFNSYVEKCDDHETIVFATKEHCPAGSDNNGGYFTQALIQAVGKWIKHQNSKSMISIFEAVKEANSIMHNKGQDQEAVIYTTSHSEKDFPFAIFAEK